MKTVRLTLERDCALTPDQPQAVNNNNNSNSNNNSGSGMAAAAADSCTKMADLSVNDADSSSTSDVARSPSPSLHRNVKRRSTVPKGFAIALFFCQQFNPFRIRNVLTCPIINARKWQPRLSVITCLA